MVHLAVFLFVMTAVIYETQHWRNPEIRNFIDARYFNRYSAHDDRLRRHHAGTSGQPISVVIMILDVTLTSRPRPSAAAESSFPLPACGLQRHDAVHCKACGTILNIPDEGLGH